jgi:hypothetical protein
LSRVYRKTRRTSRFMQSRVLARFILASAGISIAMLPHNCRAGPPFVERELPARLKGIHL